MQPFIRNLTQFYITIRPFNFCYNERGDSYWTMHHKNVYSNHPISTFTKEMQKLLPIQIRVGTFSLIDQTKIVTIPPSWQHDDIVWQKGQYAAVVQRGT